MGGMPGPSDVEPFDPQPQLNRLHHQVARLRSIVMALAVAVVALVAVTVVGLVRKPSSIVISDGDDELTMTAHSVQLKGSLGNIAISASNLQLRGSDGRYDAMDPGRFSASGGQSMATLDAGPGVAEVTLMGGNRGLGSMVVGDSESRVNLSASGKSTALVVNKDGVEH
jgi:hypothetical protein